MDRDRHDPVIKSALIEAALRAPRRKLYASDELRQHTPTCLAHPGLGAYGCICGADPVAEHKEEVLQKFETGAIRDLDNTKYDYEAFLSPLVIEGYAAYMHKNRNLKDGSVRDGDNWQKGIPLKNYVKSGWRHFFAFWKAHRSGKPFTDQQIEETYAILFNVMGYLHEIEKKRQAL